MVVLNSLVVNGSLSSDHTPKKTKGFCRGNRVTIKGRIFQIFVNTYLDIFVKDCLNSTILTLQPFYPDQEIQIEKGSIINFQCSVTIRCSRNNIYERLILPVERIGTILQVKVSDEDVSIFNDYGKNCSIFKQSRDYLSFSLKFDFGTVKVQFSKGETGNCHITLVGTQFSTPVTRLIDFLDRLVSRYPTQV